MRILHVVDGIPPDVLGGTGGIVLEIARGQAASGDTVAVLSASKRGEGTEMQGDVRLMRIPALAERWAHWRCVFSKKAAQRVLRCIEEFAPEVIHAHTISRQIGYGWIKTAKARGMKVIVTCHDVSPVAYGKVIGTETRLWPTDIVRQRWRWNPFRNILIRRALRSANRILTVSDALRHYLGARGIKDAQTVRNGIDTNVWKPRMDQAAAREALKLPKDAFLFLLAGRLGVDKGSLLIAATLPRSARIALAGSGISRELDPIKDRMHVFPPQSPEQMRLQYAASDAVLVPSLCLDCFPTVCLEAMAMERPVLATSRGGAKESVEDGKTGWIIDPADERAWNERMEWCVAHRDELPGYGEAGRRRMEETFSLPSLVQALRKIYADVIEA